MTSDSPNPTARILEIFISPVMHQPMRRLQSVRAVKNRGLEGDYRCSTSLVMKRTVTGRPQRQVSFIDVARLAEANARLLEALPDARALTTEQMRRQIVTEGIDLNDLVGKRFTAGGAEFEGVCLAEPCSIPLWTRATEAQPYLQKHYDVFVKVFDGYAGLTARALSGGVLNVGDELHTFPKQSTP